MSKTYKHKELYKIKQKQIKDFNDEELALWEKLRRPVCKIFKRIKRKERKSKERQALKDKEYDKIPKFRKSDKEEFY